MGRNNGKNSSGSTTPAGGVGKSPKKAKPNTTPSSPKTPGRTGSKSNPGGGSPGGGTASGAGAPAPAPKKARITNVGKFIEEEIEKSADVTATQIEANGVLIDVNSLEVFNALHNEFLEVAKQDHPLRPEIEAASNANTIHRPAGRELGVEWNLGNNPLNDFWQIAATFLKARTVGMVDIRVNNKTIATARYNQYGTTTYDPYHDDVMIYKAPALDDDDKSESDKGVSYKMGILKFNEIVEKLNKKAGKKAAITEKDIAKYLLDFYKDRTIPADIQNDEALLRNFGYLATLMTVPETKRNVGVFPFGLMTLHNIMNGKMTVAKAFDKDAPGYPPALEGSKALLNVLEDSVFTLYTQPKKTDWNNSNAKPQEVADMAIAYSKIAGDFLDSYPDLLTTAAATDSDEALKLLSQNIFTKLGIGPEITDPATAARVIQRAGNTALSGLAGLLQPGAFFNPPNLNAPPTGPVVTPTVAPDLTRPGALIPSSGKAAERMLTLAAIAEKSGEQETREYALDTLEADNRRAFIKARTIQERPVRPGSPTRKRVKTEGDVEDALFKNRSKRNKEEDEGRNDIAEYLSFAAFAAEENARQQAQNLQFHNQMAESLKGLSATPFQAVGLTPLPLPFRQNMILLSFDTKIQEFGTALYTRGINIKASEATQVFFNNDVVNNLMIEHSNLWPPGALRTEVENRLKPFIAHLPQN